MYSPTTLLKDCLYSTCIPVGIGRLNRNYSTTERFNLKQDESLSDFYQWFVGFCDAESSFSINPVVNSDNLIKKITFMFSIELHKDDLDVLEYIQNKLGIGRVRQDKDKCIFSVTNAEGHYLLISLFDKYNLNSTKYLDYMNFKRAFILYQVRDKELLSSNIDKAKTLTDQILGFKNSMNTKRINTILPIEHKIVITKF